SVRHPRPHAPRAGARRPRDHRPQHRGSARGNAGLHPRDAGAGDPRRLELPGGGGELRAARGVRGLVEAALVRGARSPDRGPAGPVLARARLERVAALARRFGVWVGADEAYADVQFDAPPPSMLECGKENVIAFHTLSKRSAMTGYRSGFMAGDARLIGALRRLRPNVGVATPGFIQRAAIGAWGDDAHPAEQRARYAANRALFLEYFRRAGLAPEA